MVRSHPWLGGSAAVSFVCSRGLAEAVRLLADFTPAPGSAAALEDGVVGTVSADDVRLWREVRLSGRQVRARFRGRFEATPAGTRLTGEFTPVTSNKLWHAALFLTLASVAAYAAWAIASAVAQGGRGGEAPYVGFAIFTVATLANAGANWVLAENTRAALSTDLHELSEHVRVALGASGGLDGSAAAAPGARGTMPA